MNNNILFDPYDFKCKTIENVPIYFKDLPWANCIFIRVVFKIGLLTDPVSKEGLSHFLEHMIFDGSSKFKDNKDIKKWSKENTLNTFNAYTSRYLTAFTLKIFPEKLDTVLNDLQDILFNPKIEEEYIEKERKVITQEAWARYKNQKFLDYLKEVNSIIFPNTRIGEVLSPLGFPETILDITREDVATWHKENYNKENCYIVLTGKINDNDLKSFDNFIKQIPNGNKKIYQKQTINKPKINKIVKKSTEIGEPKKQTEFSKIILTDQFEDEGYLFMFKNLVYEIIHEKLRLENSLCYSLDFSIIKNLDYMKIYFSVKTDTSNIEKVESEFYKTLQDIKEEKYIEKFNLTKKVAIEKILSAEQLSYDIAEKAVTEIYNNGKMKTIKESIYQIENTTYKDMVDFVEKYFIEDKIFTEITLSEND